jgi:hypothetical protein
MFDGALILLAEQQSFCAEYIAQVVEDAGAKVVGPFADEEAITRWLEQSPERPAAAVLSAQLQEAQLRFLSAKLELLSVPYVVISESSTATRSLMDVAFRWPFGGFQVAEALKALISAGGAQTAARSSD